MEQQQLDVRHQRAVTETLVVRETDEGFRVHNPAQPDRIHLVGGTDRDPRCDCSDFRYHERDPDWRCKHILAVFGDRPPESDPRSSRPTLDTAVTGSGLGAAGRVRLKRSVSPDGRIDALSVEFDLPLEHLDEQDVSESTGRSLEL